MSLPGVPTMVHALGFFGGFGLLPGGLLGLGFPPLSCAETAPTIASISANASSKTSVFLIRIAPLTASTARKRLAVGLVAKVI